MIGRSDDDPERSFSARFPSERSRGRGLHRRAAGAPTGRARRARPAGDVPRRRERQRQVDPRRGARGRAEAELRGRRPRVPVPLRDAAVAFAAASPGRARMGRAAAAQLLLPARGERLQPRDRDRELGLRRRDAEGLRPADPRAVARRVVPRHRDESARAERPLPPRRAGGGALAARPARADAADARAARARLPVRRRHALTRAGRLPGRDDPAARRRRRAPGRLRRRAERRADALVPRRARALPAGAARVIRSVTVERDDADASRYPFSIPALRALDTLELHPQVTLFAGENGSGKSTLIEAIAVAAGFNPEGGTRNMTFSTRASHSALHERLRLVRDARPQRDGFFLRAESFYNVA